MSEQIDPDMAHLLKCTILIVAADGGKIVLDPEFILSIDVKKYALRVETMEDGSVKLELEKDDE